MISGQRITRNSFDTMSVYPSSEVYKWATTLVVAPHPDDETLGCGGAIALLRQMGYRVHVLVVSDGTAASSVDMSPQKAREVRKMETENALSVLGVSNDSITFLDVKDNMIPYAEQPGFDEVVRLCRNKITDLKPDTLLLPWRRDPHKDHQASWQIINRAVEEEQFDANMIEYSIWAWNNAEEQHLPIMGEVQPWRLDTKPVLEKKIQAITQYSSYQSDSEADDGYSILSPDMLVHFTHPWEVYLNA